MISPTEAAAALRGALPLLGVVDTASWLAAYTSALTAQATPDVPTPPVYSAPRYRYEQGLLFQAAPYSHYTPSGAPPLLVDTAGPTAAWVDFQGGWAWDRRGGDWLDADGVRHGPKPWFSAPIPGEGATLVREHRVDCTALAQAAYDQGRWQAYLLTCAQAHRTLAGRLTGTPPQLLVEDAQGTYTVPCWALSSAALSGWNRAPSTTAAKVPLPAFVEFHKLRARPTKAILVVTAVEHWSGKDPVLEGWLLDPPIDRSSPRLGTGGGILGRQRFLDGSSLIRPGAINVNVDSHFDPALWGGPSDLSKLPHSGAGLWINDAYGIKQVDSSYTGEGFEPFKPGLGALRVHMPATTGLSEDKPTGISGTTAADAWLYLPYEDYGRRQKLHVRYRVRRGNQPPPTLADLRYLLQSGNTRAFTTMAGKSGISPGSTSSKGGVSGTSGGLDGWQMRLAWYDCLVPGPAFGGQYMGFHLYDFLGNNPPGHQYGTELDPLERWGKGGHGCVFYPALWYTVETEISLNTLTATGYNADGELRAWVDGRLAFERTGMVFRTGPAAPDTPAVNKQRPVRENGIRGLWLNVFHGGKTPNTVDRTWFYTDLAWGTEYIGPGD